MGSGTTTLIISKDDMEDIVKIVKYLEDSGSLLKRVSKTIQNKGKEQKRGFLSMLLGTKKASEWWIVKDVILKKLISLKKVGK